MPKKVAGPPGVLRSQVRMGHLLPLMLRRRWGDGSASGSLVKKCLSNSLAAALDRDRVCDNATFTENQKSVVRALGAGQEWQEVKKKKKKKGGAG